MGSHTAALLRFSTRSVHTHGTPNNGTSTESSLCGQPDFQASPVTAVKSQTPVHGTGNAANKYAREGGKRRTLD